MPYRIEALQSLPRGQRPGPDTPVETVAFRWQPEDVFRITYHYLLARHWVRIVDAESGQHVSGPFNPARVAPRPEAILPPV